LRRTGQGYPIKINLKGKTHIVRVPLWLLRVDDMIRLHAKTKFIFIGKKDEKKLSPECDELVVINGGGGLAGYICPRLPHLQ
jgi:hypothetical protein